jgi:hypothetical protein
LSEKVKAEFLQLLDKDKEFRYTVAGYLGLGEILRRLDGHDKKFNEILAELREHGKILTEHSKILSEHSKMLTEHGKILMEHSKMLTEHGEQLVGLRRDMVEVRRYIERASITLEEEAREVIQHRLKRLGIKVDLDRLTLPELELNIYGITEDLCIIGEVSTRLGVRLIDELDKKLETLSSKHPDKIRPKVVKVFYTLWATDEAVEKALKSKVWLLRSMVDLTPFSIVTG